MPPGLKIQFADTVSRFELGIKRSNFMQLNAYLNFSGQCEQAFKYYETHLGGKIEFIMTNGNSPMADKVPTEWRDKIMHARMRIGNTVVMGSDATPQHFQQPQGFNVCLSTDSIEEAERFFTALSQNGNVKMPLQQTFWAARFGALVDQFGIPWMINCDNAS
jgi:PhnB protein